MRILVAALLSVLALAAAGCAVRTVSVYSDSILANSASPGGEWYASGNAIPWNVVEDSAEWKISILSWNAVPGTTMASHPNAVGLDSTSPNTIVYSFGSNDANNFAWGRPGSDDLATAKQRATIWIGRAFDKYACVVWVLPNTRILTDPNTWGQGALYGTRSGPAAVTAYEGWMQQFTAWIRSLNGPLTLPGHPQGTVRYVDWGALVNSNPGYYTTNDRLHPSEAGAARLGQEIKTAVKSC